MTANPESPNAPTLQDRVIAFLRENKNGTSGRQIAEQFLKLNNPSSSIAALAVKGILGSDHRCFTDTAGLWHAAIPVAPIAGKRLIDLPWAAVNCIGDPSPGRRRLLYFSLWNVVPAPHSVLEVTCVDPNTIDYDEQEILGLSGTMQPDDMPAVIGHTSVHLHSHLPVFMSGLDRAHLAQLCELHNEPFPDDTILISQLLGALELPQKRPMTLETLEEIIFGVSQTGNGARKRGERFAACVGELLASAGKKGIESREDLDLAGIKDLSGLFLNKTFTHADLCAMPGTSGVYGFKNKNGDYIYIGKAANLKRRLLCYFGDTDESPKKIDHLRQNAVDLTVHQCGSELESLIYEYRLIKKYTPALNSKIDVLERKGTYQPIDDCIILLPHIDCTKVLSVWFRKNQKIRLVPFDLTIKEVQQELEEFFFSDKLARCETDFPEQELAVRWIKKHSLCLHTVPVSRLAGAEEVYDAMRVLFQELFSV